MPVLRTSPYISSKKPTRARRCGKRACARSLLTQALDMLIVQANTNTIASHFVGLLASLRIQGAADTTTAISAD